MRMELASIVQLFRDKSSNEPVLLMETVVHKEKVLIRLACQNADVLALEAHGLNNRCPLYTLLADCVRELGGSLGSAVVSIDPSQAVTGAVSLSKSGQTRWVPADVVELVAFAMHIKLPVYLNKSNKPLVGVSEPSLGLTELPTVFENALEDILKPNSAPGSNNPGRNRADVHSHNNAPRNSQRPPDSES